MASSVWGKYNFKQLCAMLVFAIQYLVVSTIADSPSLCSDHGKGMHSP